MDDASTKKHDTNDKRHVTSIYTQFIYNLSASYLNRNAKTYLPSPFPTIYLKALLENVHTNVDAPFVEQMFEIVNIYTQFSYFKKLFPSASSLVILHMEKWIYPDLDLAHLMQKWLYVPRILDTSRYIGWHHQVFQASGNSRDISSRRLPEMPLSKKWRVIRISLIKLSLLNRSKHPVRHGTASENAYSVHLRF